MALGHRAGARVRRLGDVRDTEAVISRGPRQAHLEGFDLHANVWVSGNDRAGVERLCRYILRPPFAQERLRLRSDGRIALELKTAWHDGTRELVFGGRRPAGRPCMQQDHIAMQNRTRAVRLPGRLLEINAETS